MRIKIRGLLISSIAHLRIAAKLIERQRISYFVQNHKAIRHFSLLRCYFFYFFLFLSEHARAKIDETPPVSLARFDANIFSYVKFHWDPVFRR